MKNINYIVLDLEATCDDKTQIQNEIIEIGAVKLDENLKKIAEFQIFIKPNLNPQLTDFCKELTKIEQTDVDGAVGFKEALENVTPRVEVRSRRIGGATYQIPVEVSARRGSALALKWLKTAIENIKGRDLSNKVVTVVLESLENKGWAAKKKEEVFKMAEANKAFAHYRW